MLTTSFLSKFKRSTEERWSKRSVDPTIYGFQFQRGTRWNPGLSDEEIAEYAYVLSLAFPHDFKVFLRAMNGTDMPTVNIYGSAGEPPRQSVGVYSYPRDIEIVRRLTVETAKDRSKVGAAMSEQAFDLPLEAILLPIYGHRYLVCTSDLESSVVLSIGDHNDAIVYGNSLKEYLEREFLRDHP
jgi:hypothetical protein